MVAAGEFSVSILAGDQIVEGQYFSYPGHKLRRVADGVPDRLARRPGRPAGRPRRGRLAALRDVPADAAGRPRALLRPRRRRGARAASGNRRCSTPAGSAGG